MGRPPEAGTDCLTTFNADFSSYQPDQLLDNSQSEARPAIPARGRAIGLGKGIKEVRLGLRRNADPSALHGKVEEIVRSFFDFDTHLSVGGKFHGIAEQIAENLAQSVWVPRRAVGTSALMAETSFTPFF